MLCALYHDPYSTFLCTTCTAKRHGWVLAGLVVPAAVSMTRESGSTGVQCTAKVTCCTVQHVTCV